MVYYDIVMSIVVILNSLGIKSQVIIIPNPNTHKEDYIKSITDQYKTYENVIFDYYTPKTRLL